MPPSCWNDFIYMTCCCLGDEYLDEIDAYQKAEREKLYPKQPVIQQNKNTIRKTKSYCLLTQPIKNSKPTQQGVKSNSSKKDLKWIIGDEYFNQKN